jgi:hypothetical protein
VEDGVWMMRRPLGSVVVLQSFMGDFISSAAVF